jgi:hypothetical protein
MKSEEEKTSISQTLIYLGLTVLKVTLTYAFLLFTLVVLPIPYFFIEGKLKILLNFKGGPSENFFSTKEYELNYINTVYFAFTSLSTGKPKEQTQLESWLRRFFSKNCFWSNLLGFLCMFWSFLVCTLHVFRQWNYFRSCGIFSEISELSFE